MLITGLSWVLKDEWEGVPCPPAWGSYEMYWKERMQYFARNESKEFYDRFFRDFNSARTQLGLKPIELPSYESFQEPVEARNPGG